MLTISPSLACSLTVQADLLGTRTGAGHTHHATSQPGLLGVVGLLLLSPLPPASPRTLPALGLCRPWGVDEGGRRSQAWKQCQTSFHCGSIELTLVVYGADVTFGQSHFFKLWGMCFRAPRCCPWEPNNYGTGGRAPQRGKPAGPRRGAGRGSASPPVSWALRPVSLMVRPIPISERLQYGRGHLTVNEIRVLKVTLELAKGREGMCFNWGMDLTLSRLLPVLGP